MSDQGFIATDSQRRQESVTVVKITEHQQKEISDQLTVEEPLEIKLSAPDLEEMTLAITMRTPGQDQELALGFLFTEGIIQTMEQVISIEHCSPASPDKGFHNTIRIALSQEASFDPDQLKRNFYSSASCGVCGKTSIESVMNASLNPIPDTYRISGTCLKTLPKMLSNQQLEFAHTGGSHAAGLIDSAGNLVVVREDIGRHNALDKLIGQQLLAGALPLTGYGLMLSGRPGFELIQKGAMAGIEVIAGIGPPSSLAQELAEECGITLAGFVRDTGYNLYTHPHRVVKQ